MTDQAHALALKCAEAMYKGDLTAHHYDMTIEDVGPGTARLTMEVVDFMLNGHDTCHGGTIFTLADTAFAYACNSHNQVTVAAHCSITFQRPAHRGDRLTAIAVERSKAGRNGIYDIKVVNQDGVTVAEFRGHSRSLKGTLVPAGEEVSA